MKFHSLKTVMLFCIVLCFLGTGAHAWPVSPFSLGPTEADTTMFQVGEELVYNVSYLSIDIGQIKIKVLEKINTDNGKAYKVIGYVDSYSGIPFVNLHSIYESTIDEKVFSRWHRSRTKENSKWFAAEYDFNYAARKLYIHKGAWGSKSFDLVDSLALDTLYQDGLSLYYCARQYLRSTQKASVPTMIRGEKARTVISYPGKHTKAEIDAVPYPVDVIRFDGDAEFVGIFGLTGDFEGWFSRDDARVPVLAKMKVLIGNVRVELLKWTRQGWSPPRYTED